MPYRILAVDLDNTLVSGLTGISEASRGVLARAETAGCRVVISTARGRWSTRPVLRELPPISGPHIVFNGAATFSCFEDEPEEVLILDRDVVRGSAAAAVEAGMRLSGFEDPRHGDRVYVDRPNEGLGRWAADNPERVVVVDDVTQVIDRDLVVLLGWGSEQQARGAQQVIGQPEALGPVRVAPALQFDSYLLEITPAGATKGEALARLAARLGVDRSAVIAVGDAPPDVGMIQYAGLGVAMGNASEDVKAAADYIAPSAEEDGVAHVVERFILRQDSVTR
jgi:Cof subfamily protein (haloacid dehalogenase superfamily)